MMRVELVPNDLYAGNYLAKHSSMRRILENVIATWDLKYGNSTYIDEEGRFNNFSDSPIFIAKHDRGFRVELGCDFEYEVDETSYD